MTGRVKLDGRGTKVGARHSSAEDTGGGTVSAVGAASARDATTAEDVTPCG